MPDGPKVLGFPGVRTSPVAEGRHGKEGRFDRREAQEAYVQESESIRRSRPEEPPELSRKQASNWAAAQRPTALHELDAAIEASARILTLQDDWDGAGAQAYRHETWMRAVRFLRANASEAASRLLEFATPRILEGPSGSIDLHWQMDDFEILVNVPEDSNEPIRFFGDDRKDTQLKGTIGDAGSSVIRILPWLTGS